jgi:hypothetical protein
VQRGGGAVTASKMRSYCIAAWATHRPAPPRPRCPAIQLSTHACIAVSAFRHAPPTSSPETRVTARGDASF